MGAARHEVPGITWTGMIEVDSGEAYQGPWRMNASDFRYVDDPTVAIDREGVVGVAWADQARKDIFYQAYGPDGNARLHQPVNVSRSPEIFSWLPRIAFGPGGSGGVYVLWQEIVFSGGSHGGEIFFARSADGGRSFSEPMNLSNTPAGDGKGRLTRRFWNNGSLDLAVDSGGELFAAWTEYEGALWFCRSTDGGASFTEPLHVAGRGAEPARGPALAVGPGDAVSLVWTVGEDPAADIHIAKSRDGGRSFGQPSVVHQSPGHADAPKIAVDDEGTVHLVYAESSEGPLQRYEIRYARSTDGAATFEAARTIADADSREYESVSFPSLSLDGANNVYLVWEIFPDPNRRPRGLGFAVSRDGGRTFTDPSIVPGTSGPGLGVNGSLQGLLMSKLAVNGSGAIAVVNSTFSPNEASRVRLVRGQVAGR